MMRTTRRRWLAIPLALVAAVVVAGCENPIGEGGHPAGVVILDGQTQVAAFGLVGGVSGRVTVAPGSTRSFRVMLTDAGGSRIPLDGIEYSVRNLVVVLTPLATARFTGVDGLEVTGRSAGVTSLEFQVWHGGHEEFRVNIPLAIQ